MKPVYANFFSVSKTKNVHGETVELVLNVGHKYMEQSVVIGPNGVESVSTPAVDPISSILLTPENAAALRTLLNKTLGESEEV